MPTISAAPSAAKSSLKDSIFKKSAKSAMPIEQDSMADIEECEEDSYFDFEEQHESKLEERMKHISDTFSQYLMYLIRDKKMENAEVYKRAIPIAIQDSIMSGKSIFKNLTTMLK